ADPRRGFQGIADRPAFEYRLQFLQQPVLDPLLDDETGAGRAVLALAEENGRGHILQDRRKVLDIVHHDGRALAAAFEDDPLHVGFGRIFQEVASYLAGAGETDAVDVLVHADRPARRRSHAGDDVDHAIGDA